MTTTLHRKQQKLYELLKCFLCFVFEKSKCAGTTCCLELFLNACTTVQMIKIYPSDRFSAGWHISHSALGKAACPWDQSDVVQW